MSSLSDYILHSRLESIGGQIGVEHVKDFIKKLKENLRFTTDPLDKNKPQEYVDILNRVLEEKIDNLAGPKLT